MLDLIISLVYLLLVLLIGLVTVGVIYARWHYGTLERIKGVPAVVKPAFMGGSDIFLYKKIVHDTDSANVQKYGKIFGFYEGRIPKIFISDPEMIRLIFVKDFDHFKSKMDVDSGEELLNDMLDFLPYEKWKVVRSFLSPNLTTGKIRNMSSQMVEGIDNWMNEVKQKVGSGTFWPKKMYGALTVDVITRCAFGTKLNSLHDPDNIFVQHLDKLSREDFTPNFFLTIMYTFPFIMKFIPWYPPDILRFFVDVLKKVMTARREEKVKVNDFVDCLNEMLEKVETAEYKRLGITETTVMCQALEFFIAGFETTAGALTKLTYHLSKDPAIQERAVKEVDSYLERHNGKIEHETIGELTYLLACAMETLRMYPPTARLERVCTKDWYHQPTGLQVPEGIYINVPIYSVHFNAEYYPNPHTFNPDRFLPENKDKLNPYTFLSFGLGNRGCLGMRFAKEEMVLALANVLKNYTFKANASTKITFRPGRPFLHSIDDFNVEAILRK